MDRRTFMKVGLGISGAMTLPALSWARPKTLTIGSSVAASSQYVVSVQMANAIKAELPDTNVSLIETGATIDNIRRLSRGEIQLGQASVEAALMAVEGKHLFAGHQVKDLVAVYCYDDYVLNIVVREDSGITSLSELEGKRFNPGLRGSSTEAVTREAFRIAKIKPLMMPGTVADAVEGILNGNMAGYAKSSPSKGLDASIREIMLTTPIRLLSFDEDLRKEIMKNLKGVDFRPLQEDLIPNQKNPIYNPVIPMSYSTRLELMDDDTAFAIARAIHTRREMLISVWPHLKEFDFVQRSLGLESLDMPLHPGAKRYWESVA